MERKQQLSNFLNPVLRYKSLLIDLIINIFSFSLLIITQQIITLPIISRFYNSNDFGEIILAFGISNIITSMFGFSIGSARLLDNKAYNVVYIKVLKISNVIVFVISFFIYKLLFSGNYIDSLIFSSLCVIGSIRYFFLSEFRFKDNHNDILKQNLFYFVGAILGLLLILLKKNWLIVFLTAEIFSVSYSYYILKKQRFFKLFKDTSTLTTTNILHLIINNAAAYSLMYYDRFVIFPILGPANVSIYYSASVSSKIGGLIINPMSNFILGKLAKEKDEAISQSVNKLALVSIFITVLYFVLSVIATPILVYLLYPNNFSEIKDIFLVVCLGAAIMGGIGILKPIVMKKFGVKYFNRKYILYGILLITLSILFCIKYGLFGVAIANIISGICLFLWLLWVLIKKNDYKSH